MHPCTLVALRGAVEVDDLAARVHAGVRASGAGHLDRVIGDERQRRFDIALHAAAVRQSLPAEEIRAVVFDAKRDAQKSLREKGKPRF